SSTTRILLAIRTSAGPSPSARILAPKARTAPREGERGRRPREAASGGRDGLRPSVEADADDVRGHAVDEGLRGRASGSLYRQRRVVGAVAPLVEEAGIAVLPPRIVLRARRPAPRVLRRHVEVDPAPDRSFARASGVRDRGAAAFDEEDLGH